MLHHGTNMEWQVLCGVERHFGYRGNTIARLQMHASNVYPPALFILWEREHNCAYECHSRTNLYPSYTLQMKTNIGFHDEVI